jgi:hypothetical protein
LANKIIFHYPGPLFTSTDTGEKKRPKKILEAFQSLNYDVTILTGHYQERYTQFQKIKNQISKFDFIYSENSNMPLSTTGKSKIPNLNSVDYQLFKLAKDANVPSGVFIRDVFWLVKETVKEKGLFKQVIGKILFNHEINHYRNCNSVFFIPADPFKTFLASSKHQNFSLLPPGAELINFKKNEPSAITKFVYVGSCKPPVYQVTNGFQNILNCPNTHLTIISRANEHESIKSTLVAKQNNLTIISASDLPLSEILQKQDIGLACIDQNEYWGLTIPIKIYDYIGHQMPILTFNNGETAKLIKTNQLGWVLENAIEIPNFIKNLTPFEITQKSAVVKNYLKQNTWVDRAKYISTILQKNVSL